MRLILDTLTKFLNLGSRKILSCHRSTYLPNIFARRGPRAAARSAKLRAAKSARRIHSTAARGANRQTARRRHAKRNPPKALQRCNTAVAPPPATYPHPPGAYILEPSFVVPGFPEVDDKFIPPLVVQKLFLDALYAERQALLRAAEEREAAAEEARRRAEEEAEAEFARLLELDSRKAKEAHRKAVEEEFVRLLEEDRRKAQEAHRRAMEEEERRRAEQEQEKARKRKRRERKRERERERQQRQNPTVPDPPTDPQPSLEDRLLAYEDKWTVIRGNDVPKDLFCFFDFPWPVFEDVETIKDVTEERVLAFLRHLLQGQGEGQAKPIRSELRRWHPDKFDVRVLNKVVDADREEVKATAEHVARILTSS